MKPWMAYVVFLACATAANAEQYVVSTDFHTSQPATFRVSLNGQTLLLHRAANGNMDITPWVKTGKNTLTVDVILEKTRTSSPKAPDAWRRAGGEVAHAL